MSRDYDRSICSRSTVRVSSLTRNIAARWRMLWFAITAILGLLALPDTSAAQQGYWAWAPLGVGCARSISVGPNGVPWILGCTGGDPNGTGPAWVYYLSWPTPQGSFVPQYQWNYDNLSAGMYLYVNLNGIPYVSDNVGNVWYEAGMETGGTAYTPTPIGSWNLGGNCCVGPIAVGVSIADDPPVFPPNPPQPSQMAGEMFYPFTSDRYQPGWLARTTDMWALGCPPDPKYSTCSGGPYIGALWQVQGKYEQFTPISPTYNNYWTFLSYPPFLVTLAMFTQPDQYISDITVEASEVPGYQSLWGLDIGYQVWTWLGNQWHAVRLPPSEVGARWISDGAVLGLSNNLYMCFGDQAQCAAGNDWTYVVGPYTTSGAPVSLKQIATGGWASQAIIGLSPFSTPIRSMPPYNPIAWAIDSNGNIYFTKWVEIGPIQ
jgi:hypothetical protein